MTIFSANPKNAIINIFEREIPMKCNYCETEFEGKFCPKCGAAASGTSPASVSEQTGKPAKKKKPFYLRWWFILIAVLVIGFVVIPISISNSGTDDSEFEGKYEIPNVFGVNYEDASDILEDEGFKVKAIATSVKSISDKLYHPLESVEKNTVFKIDNYVQDGIGDIRYNGNDYCDKMSTNKKSVVIYYAKEDYEKAEQAPADEQEAEVADADYSDDESGIKSNSGEIRSDFKAAMDSYEKFFDEYVAIMKKYADNPSDASILSDYTKYMGKYTQMMSDLDKWESEDMTDAELAYYLEVQARITKKLLEVSK